MATAQIRYKEGYKVMKDVISVDKVIVNYRIKCDIDLSDREELLISQEEYEEAIQFNLNRSKEDIHSLLISKLPEKKPLVLEKEYSTPRELLTHEQDIKLNTNHQILGFNQAVDDMRKSIDGLFNEV